MIHLIICGHGQIADGLLSGLKLLAGEVNACHSLNFPEGMSSESLAQSLRNIVADYQDEPILMFTDIMGGTPFRQAALIANERPDCEIISGMNLPLLIEAVMERDEAENVADFAENLVQNTRGSIARYSALLQSRIKNNPVVIDDDGI